MAVPEKIRDNNINRLKFIEEQADSFDGSVEDIQDTMFKRVMSFLNKLDTDDDGNIKPTVSNLQLVNNLSRLRGIVITDSYRKAVESYLKKFDQVKDKTDGYFKSLPENG